MSNVVAAIKPVDMLSWSPKIKSSTLILELIIPIEIEGRKNPVEFDAETDKLAAVEQNDMERKIRMLDDNDWRNQQSQLALNHCSNVHTWSNRIIPFNKMISDALDKQLSDVIQSGDKKEDIVNFVKRKKMVDTQTMSDYLGWGKQIGFRRYRNYLRTIDGLYTTMINKKEYYVYNESFTTV